MIQEYCTVSISRQYTLTSTLVTCLFDLFVRTVLGSDHNPPFRRPEGGTDHLVAPLSFAVDPGHGEAPRTLAADEKPQAAWAWDPFHRSAFVG